MSQRNTVSPQITEKKNFLNLQEKVVIITGAATGLGATAAIMLSRAGAKVLINHITGQESLANKVSEACANETLCCAGDITKDEDCVKTAQAAVNQWGRIDILINNAGINKPVEHTDLHGLNAEDFIAIYNVNVIGAFQMIRAVATVMKSQGAGVVVNVSSGSGENGYGSSVAYSASKGAMNTMTKSLARALAPEIRVNAICPGFINTPLWDKLNLSESQWQAMQAASKASTPLNIVTDAEIVSRSIIFLASDLSAHLTGQLITTDGGSQLGVYNPMFTMSSMWK